MPLVREQHQLDGASDCLHGGDEPSAVPKEHVLVKRAMDEQQIAGHIGCASR
jgi:hypothetical protein